MSDIPPDEQQRRDDLLRRLLQTPPTPRPKRERDKPDATRVSETPASGRKPAPSA